MKKTVIWLLLSLGVVVADEERFREQFADPATRAGALAGLTPGTREAFFFSALDHQLAGREEGFLAALEAWKTASSVKENPVSEAGLGILENRQLLLDYGKTPEVALAEIIRRLGLTFDDSRPDVDAAVAALPTRLDPAALLPAAYEVLTAERSPQRPYVRFRGERLWREMDQVADFDEAKVSWFLTNGEFSGANHLQAVTLVKRGLELEPPIPFGSVAFHRELTFEQLQALLKQAPRLRESEPFAIAYLKKQRPGAETDFDLDLPAHAAHLQSCRDYVIDLPPALNSLKAHVLFHHLRLQRELGNFPQQDFLAFLALPRNRHEILIVNEDAKHVIKAAANNDHRIATGNGPVTDESAFIEELLQHFLSETDAAAAFAPFVKEDVLTRLHAQARLLAGANPERWSRALGVTESKALYERTSIRFAPGAPKLFDADAAVALALDLKNTPELLIRIYELDLPAQSKLEVGIDLEGLVPHHERRMNFPHSPWLQHRESLPLPELTGPGAWLVEFVSGQDSARALVRKGRLIALPERIANGQSIRVFDEAGKVVMGAVVELGQETLSADATGRIFVPDAPNQPATVGTLRAGKLAASLNLKPRKESLALNARFLLDREQLLADMEATLHLQIRLSNHGHEVPLERIENPALTLRAVLLGEVTTERVIAEDLKLTPKLEIPFHVPANLQSLTLTLSGTVRPTTGGEPVKLKASETFTLNTDLTKSGIATAFFSPTAEGHRLELRGRNGEPLPSRSLRLNCLAEDYHEAIRVQVRTDDAGRVDLGKLDGIRLITAVVGDHSFEYVPDQDWVTLPSDLHVRAGAEIRLPLARKRGLERAVLVEMRDHEPVRDHSNKLAIADGQLVIRGLPPGDYELVQERADTTLTVSGGIASDGLLVSPARILPEHQPAAPTIAEASAENGELVVRLTGHGPATRVSLIGRRYQHLGWDETMALRPFTRPLPAIIRPGFASSGYLTERRLSDEMRYILDRRAARTFPGSMLPRPSLLLNRWTEQDIDQEVVTYSEGSGGREETQGSGFGSIAAYAEPSDDSEPLNDPVACDFLAVPSVVRIDLQPDVDGVVRLPLADFAGCQFVTVAAVDAGTMAVRELPLPASETPLRDRRIARPFDPQVHFLATRSAAVLAKGAEAAIENLLDADWRAFSTMAEAHLFLYGMTKDERLREFVFLTEWPELDEAKKLDLLAKHACHELHLFLARKDAAFFAAHIKPMLAAKPEPQFIDDLLLGRDLAGYLRPCAWQRLNAAEKALLARAVPDARARIARELDLRWKLEAPEPDQQTLLFTQTLRGSDLAVEDSLGLAKNDLLPGAVGGTSYLTSKLLSIIIPRIDFEDTTLEEAIDFLRSRSIELDSNEADPSRKGFNLVVGKGVNPGTVIPELKLTNVPLGTALQYIVDAARLRYEVGDFAVTLVAATEPGEDLHNRSFRVSPNFISALQSGGGGDAGAIDPLAASSGEALLARRSVQDLLSERGVTFPPGASVTFDPTTSTLVVRNTPDNVDIIEQMTASLSNSGPADPFAGPMDPFSAPSGAQLGGVDGLGQRRVEAVPPMLFPERTKLWRESNYFRHRGLTDESLIPLNRFWLDLAVWNGKGIFLSPHFNACHRSANEALMCLALLDLPFKAERPEITVDGSTLRVKARDPMILFHKDTRQTAELAGDSPLLIRQFFHPLDEAMRRVDDREVENPVTGDFRPGVAYGAWMVVTNPAGVERRIDVLAQIPAGAIPLAGKPVTLAETKVIRPYGVLQFKMAFYFPATGDFPVYPLHVSEGGMVLAHADPSTLRVTNDPAAVDDSSWSVVARDGTGEQVLERLRNENFGSIDLRAIRWRLKDRPFFLAVTEILTVRLHYSAEVASFGFLHNDLPSISAYLENNPIRRELGPWFDSPLLTIRPQVHHGWETLEFDPLINPRAHRFAGKPRLTHDEAWAHYQAVLDQLAWKPQLSATDQLTLTAFLFLQDRIAEGLARFEKIDQAQLPARLQYDYVHAVSEFHLDRPAAAAAIAARNLPALPPGLWKDRFQAVSDQAQEIAALANPAPADQNPQADPGQPELNLALGPDGKLLLRHRALDRAALQLFHVDLEVLFSKDPFFQENAGTAAHPAIRPNESREVALAAAGETALELPAAFRHGNVLVAAESGSTRLLKLLDSKALEIRHQPLERTVQVLDAATNRPLPKTYIKVFAESHDGDVSFHKDGYTDLRGKFDYLSHTAVDASEIKRFAILISHPDKGSMTLIYDR